MKDAETSNKELAKGDLGMVWDFGGNFANTGHKHRNSLCGSIPTLAGFGAGLSPGPHGDLLDNLLENKIVSGYPS